MKNQLCPVCEKPSVYLSNLDRAFHVDGSENMSCWAEVLRAAAEGASRSQLRFDLLEFTKQIRGVESCKRRIITALQEKEGEWVSGSVLRRRISSKYRDHFYYAINDLLKADVIKFQPAERNGLPGRRFKIQTLP